MKKYVILLAAAVVISGAIFIYSKNTKNNQVCFNGSCFEVELALTAEERAKGLMNRENLEQDKGMLFIFEEEGNYPFWMKNTKIPLDIIWINKNKEVVFISKNTLPCELEPCDSINPNKMALYVLEIKGGRAQEIGLTIGDKIGIHILLPKQAIF